MLGVGPEVGFVGMERENPAPDPGFCLFPYPVDDLPHQAVSVFEGVGQGARQVLDGVVRGQILRGLSPVDEHLGAGADGGKQGAYQHLTRLPCGQGFGTQFDLPGGHEVEGCSIHAVIFPQMKKSGPRVV